MRGTFHRAFFMGDELSDNKKYYYLKLKDNYFERDNIKILESLENGFIYSNIIMKLYLKSLKYDGQLMMTDRIPYDPDKIDILSKVINHDKDHVKGAIKAGIELDIITVLDTGEIWMTDIQNFIGHTSSESERKAKYRAKLKSSNIPVPATMGQCPDSVPPEKEIELNIEKKKKKEKEEKTSEPDGSFRKHLIDHFDKTYLSLNGQKIDWNNKEIGQIGLIIKKYKEPDILRKCDILESKCRDPKNTFFQFLPSKLSNQWNSLVPQKTKEPEMSLEERIKKNEEEIGNIFEGGN